MARKNERFSKKKKKRKRNTLIKKRKNDGMEKLTLSDKKAKKQ